MRNDLLGGLKNALARGARVEDAIATFVNAGYNEFEVREAAKSITQGSLDVISAAPIPTTNLSLSNIPSSPVSQVMHKSYKKVILLTCVLLILVCALLLTLLLL